MDASDVKWKGADFYKWANVTIQRHTFIWVLQLRPVLCLYGLSFQGGCSGFGLVLLISLCTGMTLATFDGWLNTKTLGCILRGSRETVSLLSFCAFESRLTVADRQMIFSIQHSKLNNPMLTTSRVVLSSSWASFGKWESVYFSGFLAYSPLSLSLSAGHQSHPG